MTEGEFFQQGPLPRWAMEDPGVRCFENRGYRLVEPLEKPWDRFPVGTVLVDPLRPRLDSTNWLVLLPDGGMEEIPRPVARHLLQLNLPGFRAACRLIHLDPREGYPLRHLFRARRHLEGTTVMARDFIAVQHRDRREESLKAIRVSYRRLRRAEFPALSEAFDNMTVVMPGSRVFRFRKYLLTRRALEADDDTSPVLIVRSPRPNASHLRLVK